MPKDTRGKVTLSPEAYRALEVESMLMDCSLKDAASKLILKAACPKCKEILGIMARPPKDQSSQVPEVPLDNGTKGQKAQVPNGPIAQGPDVTKAKVPDSPKAKKLKLSENPAALTQIKELWKQNPRPSYADIGRIIGYPKTTVSENVHKMKEKGELD